jgi:hypothetical protein
VNTPHPVSGVYSEPLPLRNEAKVLYGQSTGSWRQPLVLCWKGAKGRWSTVVKFVFRSCRGPNEVLRLLKFPFTSVR